MQDLYSPYPEEKHSQTFSVACANRKIRIYEIARLKYDTNI